MARGTHQFSQSWLQQVAFLLGAKQRRKVTARPTRQLLLETLDRRIVLSVAPVADGDGNESEPSLVSYLSQEPIMGPIPAPVEDTSGGDLAVYPAEPIDAVLAAYYGGGEGEGGGSGSGSGSYGGGYGGGYGSGSGGGSSSGTGSGGGSGTASGSGSSATNQPPTVTADCSEEADWLIISGTVSDDGPVAGLPVSIYGIVGASATTDANGYFRVAIPHPHMMGTIYVQATDISGLTSEPFEINFG